MRKILLCVGMLVIMFDLSAQQKPHYTQYIINQYIINPAITGIENYTDIKLSHRHQWVGLQDAPVTTYVTFHTPIGKQDLRTTPTSFQVPGTNPRGKNFWDEYVAAEPHHGAGFQIINDVTGPLNRFSAYGTYAYHLGLTSKVSLSAGLGVGMTNISLDADKLIFSDVTVDPAVYGDGVLNTLRPDLNAGLYLYSADYFAGLSVQQILPQKIQFTEGVIAKDGGKQVPHAFATLGYRLGAGADFNFTPSMMVKFVQPAPVQVDLNAKLQYQDLFWLGAGVRLKDGFSGMAGLSVSKFMCISYSYDYSSSELNNFSKGTHEIVIGFQLGNMATAVREMFGNFCTLFLFNLFFFQFYFKI